MKEKDILNDLRNLKEMPYMLPEGYMEGLKRDLKSIPRTAPKRMSLWQRFSPYISMAAAFAFIFALGTLIVDNSGADEFTQEDFMVFSSNMTNIIMEDDYEQYADAAEIEDEDIIEYLIYTGTGPETIELINTIK